MAIGTRERQRQSNTTVLSRFMENESKKIEARYNGGRGDIAKSTPKTENKKRKPQVEESKSTRSKSTRSQSTRSKSTRSKSSRSESSRSKSTRSKSTRSQSTRRKSTRSKSTRKTNKKGKGEDPSKKKNVKREAKAGMKKGEKKQIKKKTIKEEVKKEEVKKEEAKKDVQTTFKSEVDRLRAQYYEANPIPAHSIGIFYNRSEAVRGPGTPPESPGSCYAKAVPMKRQQHKAYYTDF